MKGYILNNGRISMVEKNGRAIGDIVSNGTEAEVNIFAEHASLIRLANASHVIGAFNYATDHNCPVRIGQFGFWMDNKGWHFTSFNEMDVLNKMFSILYKA